MIRRIWIGSYNNKILCRVTKTPFSDYKVFLNYGYRRDNVFHSSKTSLKMAQISARVSDLVSNNLPDRKHLKWESKEDIQ